MHAGQPVEIDVDSFAGTKLSGKVASIGAATRFRVFPDPGAERHR